MSRKRKAPRPPGRDVGASSKAARHVARRRELLRRRVLIVAALGAAVALGAVFLRPGISGALSSGDPALTAAYSAPVLGNASAPVTIVEYADFQCPNCAAFFGSVEPELVRRYVDTGKAKLVFRHFAWIGGESKLAAQAASCAGAQGKFWPYHDYLYAHQRGENSGAFSSTNLKSFAAALSLDRATFDSCLDSGAYKGVVDRDFDEVRSLGLTGTPTFLINGQRIVGAQSLAVFAAAIDKQLAGR